MPTNTPIENSRTEYEYHARGWGVFKWKVTEWHSSYSVDSAETHHHRSLSNEQSTSRMPDDSTGAIQKGKKSETWTECKDGMQTRSVTSDSGDGMDGEGGSGMTDPLGKQDSPPRYSEKPCEGEETLDDQGAPDDEQWVEETRKVG